MARVDTQTSLATRHLVDSNYRGRRNAAGRRQFAHASLTTQCLVDTKRSALWQDNRLARGWLPEQSIASSRTIAGEWSTAPQAWRHMGAGKRSEPAFALRLLQGREALHRATRWQCLCRRDGVPLEIARQKFLGDSL